LVRKRLEDFDDSDKPFDYFALNKTWKKSIVCDDMETVVNGFRCNTVKYHPDIKQWGMINNIWFKDNKLKMRTAADITGPWSDERIIYEIPETTPGNVLYHKGNFCYLARECIQNYDSKNKVLTLTYDVNNSDPSEVIATPTIYTPRVIQISFQ